MTTTQHTNGHPAAHENDSGTSHNSDNDPPHLGYVFAVKEALTTRGLPVTVALIGGVAVWHADLELATTDRQTAVLLRWDELNGWTCQTRGALPTPEISFSVSAVPPPAQLAEWVQSVLTHPHVRPRRDRRPFVTRDLTTQLARYTTSTGAAT
jgi:hypothetical protein